MKKKSVQPISTTSTLVEAVVVRTSHFIRRIGVAAMLITLTFMGGSSFADSTAAQADCAERGILDYLKIAGGAWGKKCSAGVPGKSVGAIVGGVIQVFLGFLGIIFLVLTLYAGYLWMTSEGEKAKVQKAQDLLKTAVIGLVIVLAAQGLTYWILSTAAKVVTNTTT